MRTSLKVGLWIAPILIAFAACSAGGGGSVFGDDPTSAAGGGGTVTNTSTGGNTSTGTGGGFFIDASVDGSGATISSCDTQPDEDGDQDGFSVNEGDCNDCDSNVNPNAIEVMTPTEPPPDAGADAGPPEPVDEDCDGTIDNVPQPCDTGMLVNDPDPIHAANAVELCKISTGLKDWGIVGASWVLPNGQPATGYPNVDLGHGVLDSFGPFVNVQGGERMLAVSSGTARLPSHPDYQSVSGFDKGYTCGHPAGFPKESPACPGVYTGEPHDGIALEVAIRVPSNANGFSFYFNFYTYEWPNFVCSQYNDFFVALLHPVPAGQTDGNISFDIQGNPVSVNNAFVEVCGCSSGPPCSTGGKTFPCSLGDSELMGTGFGPDTEGDWHAATSWLFTQAPIEDGTDQIVIRWGVYDSGDGVLDSTTLVDNWQWIATPGTHVVVGTEPVPDPK